MAALSQSDFHIHETVGRIGIVSLFVVRCRGQESPCPWHPNVITRDIPNGALYGNSHSQKAIKDPPESLGRRTGPAAGQMEDFPERYLSRQRFFRAQRRSGLIFFSALCWR